MINFKEEIGKKYNRWTIIGIGKIKKYKDTTSTYVKCRCECGIEKQVESQSIFRNLSKSCGCYNREVAAKRKLTHGLSMESPGQKSLEYSIWLKMKSRCFNPKDKNYKDYGGRGIKVCPQWTESIVSFIQDMGIRPEPRRDYSIERIDYNGDYCPENCKWIHKSQQSKNKRDVPKILYNGKSQCLMDWCRELNLNYGVIRHRVNNLKMDFTEAMKYPKYKKCKYLVSKQN